MVDKVTGESNDISFNELCFHVARVVVQLHADKGSRNTFLEGELTDEQSDWIVKNFFRVSSANINDLSAETSDVFELLLDLDSLQTVLSAKNKKHKVVLDKLADVAGTADAGPTHAATPSIDPRARNCLLYISPSPRARQKTRMSSFSCKKKKQNKII